MILPRFRAVPSANLAMAHPLHGSDRSWPETNCYLDLWIELLHALGRDPISLLGLAVALDWESDHFTFLKPSPTDIFALTGLSVHELALWDDTEAHVVTQVERGSVPLLEVDAFFLPDTHSNAYQHKHTKTTIAIGAIEPGARWLEYFHNADRFTLKDDDYDGVLGKALHRPALFPFAELVRVSADPPSQQWTREYADQALVRYARSRMPGSPIQRFAAALPDLLLRIGTDPARINAMCFNTTRQLGSTFGLLADHLAWLGRDHADAAWLADNAKILQFQISRAARRARPDPGLFDALAEIAAVWDRCMQTIATQTHGRCLAV